MIAAADDGEKVYLVAIIKRCVFVGLVHLVYRDFYLARNTEMSDEIGGGGAFGKVNHCFSFLGFRESISKNTVETNTYLQGIILKFEIIIFYPINQIAPINAIFSLKKLSEYD